jgi:phage terminase large subunit-like protein
VGSTLLGSEWWSPALKTGASFIEHEVKIRFTLEDDRAGHATIRNMEFMRRALIINGHTCRWSPSMAQDRTTQMVIYLSYISGTPMIPLDDEVKAEVIRHLLEQDVVME